MLSFGVVAALVPVAIGAGTEERSVAAQAAPGTVTVRVYPEADTFVTEASPGGNFGGEEYVDVYGGRNPSCVLQSTPTYGLMRFDLSTIPAGAVLDVRIVTTTRAGYAQDGDPNHHVLFLDDDAWTESGVTWATRPSDGTVAPGNPTMQVGGGDIRFSDRALGSAFVLAQLLRRRLRRQPVHRSSRRRRRQRVEAVRGVQGGPDREVGERAVRRRQIVRRAVQPELRVLSRWRQPGVLGPLLVGGGA